MSNEGSPQQNGDKNGAIEWDQDEDDDEGWDGFDVCEDDGTSGEDIEDVAASLHINYAHISSSTFEASLKRKHHLVAAAAATSENRQSEEAYEKKRRTPPPSPSQLPLSPPPLFSPLPVLVKNTAEDPTLLFYPYRQVEFKKRMEQEEAYRWWGIQESTDGEWRLPADAFPKAECGSLAQLCNSMTVSHVDCKTDQLVKRATFEIALPWCGGAVDVLFPFQSSYTHSALWVKKQWCGGAIHLDNETRKTQEFAFVSTPLFDCADCDNNNNNSTGGGCQDAKDVKTVLDTADRAIVKSDILLFVLDYLRTVRTALVYGLHYDPKIFSRWRTLCTLPPPLSYFQCIAARGDDRLKYAPFASLTQETYNGPPAVTVARSEPGKATSVCFRYTILKNSPFEILVMGNYTRLTSDILHENRTAFAKLHSTNPRYLLGLLESAAVREHAAMFETLFGFLRRICETSPFLSELELATSVLAHRVMVDKCIDPIMQSLSVVTSTTQIRQLVLSYLFSFYFLH